MRRGLLGKCGAAKGTVRSRHHYVTLIAPSAERSVIAIVEHYIVAQQSLDSGSTVTWTQKSQSQNRGGAMKCNRPPHRDVIHRSITTVPHVDLALISHITGHGTDSLAM